jgi:PIN domain nuclease of toxin-antitoxin system
LGSPQLSLKARRTVERGPVAVSVVSYWEVVIKVGLGRLSIPDPIGWWAQAVKALAAQELPVRAKHVDALVALPPFHKDPFDRLLIAQAKAEDYGIVTHDQTIAQYPIQVIW